jgi:hypothetical protein
MDESPELIEVGLAAMLTVGLVTGSLVSLAALPPHPVIEASRSGSSRIIANGEDFL